MRRRAARRAKRAAKKTRKRARRKRRKHRRVRKRTHIINTVPKFMGDLRTYRHRNRSYTLEAPEKFPRQRSGKAFIVARAAGKTKYQVATKRGLRKAHQWAQRTLRGTR